LNEGVAEPDVLTVSAGFVPHVNNTVPTFVSIAVIEGESVEHVVVRTGMVADPYTFPARIVVTRHVTRMGIVTVRIVKRSRVRCKVVEDVSKT
jgi:hypothetical protein